jgi:hypothetical protein
LAFRKFPVHAPNDQLGLLPRICLIALVSRFVHHVKKDDFDGFKDDARKHRRGLWADAHPVAPWEWRKERKAAK